MGSFKFEVGEVVIIDSKYAPEFNGVATVSNRSTISMTLRGGAPYKGKAYQIEGHPSKDGWFMEASLRKKPEPSQFSFNELMQSLRIKDQV